MTEEFGVDPSWTDKDSKVTKFRELYERHEFLDAYAAHTELRIQADPKGAIGRADEWESHGWLQLKFLMDHGLKPHSRLLDIGCGVGRAARRLVPYLDVGNYTGADICAACIERATDLSRQEGWAARSPTFLLNGDVEVPGPPFNFIWAHSVFTHLPPRQIETMVGNASARLKKDGQFLFTYKRGTEPMRTGLKQFRYPFSFFREIATRFGLSATMLDMVWPGSQRTGLMARRI
jgi:SAM-dependent methyltransferase